MMVQLTESSLLKNNRPQSIAGRSQPIKNRSSNELRFESNMQGLSLSDELLVASRWHEGSAKRSWRLHGCFTERSLICQIMTSPSKKSFTHQDLSHQGPRRKSTHHIRRTQHCCKMSYNKCSHLYRDVTPSTIKSGILRENFKRV